MCSAHSWGSYCECLGVGLMISCLVTTLAVLYHHRKDPMAFDSYTNYAVMIALGIVLVVASLCTLKKVVSRWWRANSVASFSFRSGVLFVLLLEPFPHLLLRVLAFFSFAFSFSSSSSFSAVFRALAFALFALVLNS